MEGPVSANGLFKIAQPGPQYIAQPGPQYIAQPGPGAPMPQRIGTVKPKAKAKPKPKPKAKAKGGGRKKKTCTEKYVNVRTKTRGTVTKSYRLLPVAIDTGYTTGNTGHGQKLYRLDGQPGQFKKTATGYVPYHRKKAGLSQAQHEALAKGRARLTHMRTYP